MALYDPVGLFSCDARVVPRVLPVIVVMLCDAAGLLPLFSFPAAESSHHVDAAKAVAGGDRADRQGGVPGRVAGDPGP